MPSTTRGSRPLSAVTRREFLVTSAIGGAGLLQPSPSLAALLPSQYPFTLGVASGDPTPAGVVLWTRLAPTPLNGGGMPAVPVLVRWEVAHDPQMLQLAQQGVVVAWPSGAHSVHVEVNGLEPDRWYYYRFTVDGHASPVGRTRTLPPWDSSVEQFRFAFVSCQDWQNGFYAAYRNLALEDVDLVLHLGDYIYEDAAIPDAIRQHLGLETFTLANYRNRHALYKTDPHLQAAHAAFPWLVVPDDHDVDNNYADGIPQEEALFFRGRRANAYRAYYEHMPLRRYSAPRGAAARLYRGLTVGDLVQFSALDTRQYRSDQPCGDGLRFPCAGAFDPAQTMTGPAQERWLLERLAASPARWNVIAQQTMFAQFDFLAGEAQLFNMDQWDGYVAARNRITRFLEAATPSNPIVLTGDIHSSWAHNLKADYADESSAVVGTEFVGTSVTSDFQAILIPFVEAALADNPHTLFFDGQYRGYVRCTVTRSAWQTEFRAVPTILTPDVDAFTLASFVVQDGVPGALPG